MFLSVSLSFEREVAHFGFDDTIVDARPAGPVQATVCQVLQEASVQVG